ncbi:MAG: class I SAM-dependent methyltransferase [Candidatus Omnitrophica bacterium]|nr:class I SAM-dependent methyltransferase [Candidatus Omnitrophota bacterium]
MSQARSVLLENERRFYREQKHIDFYEGKGDPRQLYAHEQVRRCMTSLLRRKGATRASRILNLACSTGEADMKFLTPVTDRIIGIDVTQECLLKFHQSFGMPCVNGDVLQLPFQNESFDFAVCSGLLHHLISQGRMEDFILEFKRILKPGGWLVANEPNLFFPNGFPMLILQKIKPGIMGLVPGERPLSPFYMMRKLKKCGFQDVDVEAASYVYNRFPLSWSKAIAQREENIRRKPFFKLFGWWNLVYGQKTG